MTEPSPDGTAEEPRKRRKKRRKPKSDTAGLRPALDADGRDRAAFLLAFPEDPELEALIRAFEAGDYASVRREAPLLAKRTESRAVREAALELRRRIDPDPLARYLLAASFALLLFLTLWAYLREH